MVGFVTDAAVVITSEPVTIALPLTNDVPTTCKDELADVIPIPTLPLEPLIVILTVPLVSNDKF